jgi:amino acid transporter
MPIKKKFGAFAGVFTPSILTILGVIMYLRLGWVVGQAGLITALGIILLSHVISLSTGLSISSIATDKKIKTGGIYYMLSRSLGLPMGGSIGITLFIGTALSISLYIIGFCESFLGIELIREITGLDNTIQNFRLLGSIMLGILVIIAFISTSIAIKTQFFILGAIILSLVSIGIGLFSGDTSSNGDISWMPVADGISIATVFAIFFPAVTGFTAGVAMSGDLKNPQKNIPYGTMASIITGLLVYVALALAFALMVDRRLLLEDNNFLMRIAWSSPLVVAGIWGATLSSALGGILGGPRILQAMSRDRITPKVFGKSYGINKEPRNALIFIFLLAEAGILIGELDVIAVIVSMFYISAYGFINLSFALEKWASADFRPSFRISKWIGIIGFVACFGVMFKLDTPVMFLSMIILAGIYFYIKRKKLELDFGDVWQSVWSSMVRAILHRIDRKGIEERNWRPNIIMFSGGSKTRPHLIQFGKDLVGNQGFLSNFYLILNKSSSVLFKKHQQSVDDEFAQQNEGIFTRRQECKDIYEGIEAISSTYGFSGVEPNTVLLGWARHSEDPVRFAKMIRTLGELDLNILMMDYDKEVGFGKKEIIDVWCRGGGNNCNLVLSLVKFMWLSDNWRNARIRILIINPYNDEKERLIEDTEKILESVRMDAEIKIINNQIEKRPVNELIEVESSNSDLVFIGIPLIREGEEQTYVKQVNKLCQNLGTAILVKASSYFTDFEIGHRKGMIKHDKSEYSDDDIELVISRKIKVPDIQYPDDPNSIRELQLIFKQIKEMNETVFNEQIVDLFSLNRTVYAHIINESKEAFTALKSKLNKSISADEWKIAISETYRKIFNNALKIIDKQEKETFPDQMEILQKMVSFYKEKFAELIKHSPDLIIKEITRDDLRVRKGDKGRTIRYKLRKQLLYGSFRGTKKQKIRFKKLVASHFEKQIYSELSEVLRNWGMISLQQVIKTQEVNNRIFDAYFLLNKSLAEEKSNSLIEEIIIKNQSLKEQIDNLNEVSIQSFYTLMLNKTFYVVRQLSRELQMADTANYIRSNEKLARGMEHEVSRFSAIPVIWQKNQHLLNNFTRLELILFIFTTHAQDELRILLQSLDTQINHQFIDHLNNIEAGFGHSTHILNETLEEAITRLDPETFELLWKETTEKALVNIRAFSKEVVQKIDLVERSVFDDFKSSQFESHKATSLRARKLVEHILQQEFIIPIEDATSETMMWFLEETNKTSGLIDESMTILSLIISDKTNAIDFPQLKKYHTTFSDILQNSERISTRLLNQIQERINALNDKLSLHAITRRTGFFRKFIK